MAWIASGEPLRRIKYACENAQASGFVEFDDRKPNLFDQVVRAYDASIATPRAIRRLVAEHILGGGVVRGQKDTTGEFDEDFWYSVTLPVADRLLFVKFVIHPDENDEPGILIKSIHPDSI